MLDYIFKLKAYFTITHYCLILFFNIFCLQVLYEIIF